MKMIKRAGEIIRNTAGNGKGGIKLALSDLKDFPGINEKLGMFSLAEIGEGEMVDFHIHEGDAELYYILEGKGLYDDNGEKVEVEAGTVDFEKTYMEMRMYQMHKGNLLKGGGADE